MTSTAASLRARLIPLYAALIAVNLGAWAWALIAFRHHPLLLGTALLAYGFGLRHAVDADHIAAIDAVTRKFMQRGERPLGVGLAFSLGHSTVVIVATLGMAFTAISLHGRFERFHEIGSTMGTFREFDELTALVASGLPVAVDSVHELADYPAALDRLASGAQFGKVVLRH